MTSEDNQLFSDEVDDVIESLTNHVEQQNENKPPKHDRMNAKRVDRDITDIAARLSRNTAGTKTCEVGQDLFGEKFSTVHSGLLHDLNSVRKEMAIANISPPQIAIIGEQSAGKSSVIEAICGVELPRGQTITTRVPLILVLENSADVGEGEQVINVSKSMDFSGAKNLSDRFEMEDVIRQFTEELVPRPGDVDDIPIYCRVVRRNCPNIVLVDLPGLAHVSSDQEVSKTIADKTRAMIENYIKSDSTTILVTIESSRDFGTQEVIKLAKAADPSGERTLGILTKADRLEPGCGFVDKLRSKDNMNFKLGYVAVRNRTQQDHAENVSMEQARELEREFFTSNPIVQNLREDEWGIVTLLDRLVDLQGDLLRRTLPGIREQLEDRERDLNRRLKAIPDDMNDTDSFLFLDSAVRNICKKYLNLAEGEYSRDERQALCRDLTNEAEDLQRRLADPKIVPSFIHPNFAQEIIKRQDRTKGAMLPNFLCGRTFRDIVRDELNPPIEIECNTMIDECHFSCSAVLDELIVDELSSFPLARSTVQNTTKTLLKQLFDDLAVMVKEIMASENRIFTINEEYTRLVSGLKNLKPDCDTFPNKINQMDQYPQNVRKLMTDLITIYKRESRPAYKNVLEMQFSLEAYSAIVQRRIVDQMLKLVFNFLVNKLHEKLPPTMYSHFDGGKAKAMCERDASETKKRDELLQRIEAVKKCKHAIRNY